MLNKKSRAAFLFMAFAHALSGSLPAGASVRVPAQAEEALVDVDALVREDRDRGSCPGLGLVESCGNSVCELKKGETEATCPSDCVQASVRSYNQQTLCREVLRIEKPATIEEAQDAIRAAVAADLPIRVVGRAHSANSQLCTPGVVISTERLNRVHGLETFHGKETVLTEAGATLYELAEWLHERRRSLGYAVIGFRGVSVAGAAATGAHGSSPKHSTVVSSAIESVWVIGADGELREYSEQDTDAATWKALRANLGMLGMVVALRMSVEPQFNLKVKFDHGDEKRLFKGGGALSLVRDCDYGFINWFPGTRKFTRACGRRTKAAADPGAANVLLNPPVNDFMMKMSKKSFQYGACHPNVACLLERARYWMTRLLPPFQKRDEFLDETFYTENATGPSHRMMSSEMTPYQRGIFQTDWEIALPASRAQAALEAARAHMRKYQICLPLVGVFLRFAPAEETTLLAHTVAQGEFKPGEPTMFIELPTYAPPGFPPERLAEYERPYIELGKMLIERFGGRPHWGKNTDELLRFARERNPYGSNMDEFRSVVRHLDPQGRFMNAWGKYLGLGEKDSVLDYVMRRDELRSCRLEARASVMSTLKSR